MDRYRCDGTEKPKFMNNMIPTLIENFKKRRIQCNYFSTSDELLNWLENEIPRDSLIGVGDSLTLDETGVSQFLRLPKFKFLDKYDASLTRSQKDAIYLSNFSSDCFFLGANGISLTGEIVQIDGNGSRVAPMLWGPKKVYIVAGTNKISPTLEEAKQRARQIAGPLDAKRLHKKTPCAYTGICIDCQSLDRICNSFVTLSGQFDPERVTVCLVGEAFGF